MAKATATTATVVINRLVVVKRSRTAWISMGRSLEVRLRPRAHEEALIAAKRSP
jgi:hypothetical protein